VTSSIRLVIEAVRYSAKQKLVAPLRRLLWGRRKKPFVFRAEKGLRFHLIPPEMIDGEIYAYGIYERQLLHLLHDRLSGRVMLDVGANIGNHALFLADRFEKTICFEPNPVVVERLKRNVALNGRQDIDVYAIGLSDKNAELPFHNQTTGNLGGGTFVHTQFPVSDVLPVRVGDEILAAVRGVDFVKVDVEGFEIQAIRGLGQTIRRDKPIIVFEYDELRGEPGRWESLKAVLPGYCFAEVQALPGSGFSKLRAATKLGVEPRLARLDRPKQPFYEAVLAFPNDSCARRFGVADSQ
jgi:FkbM family methyltransferase